MIVKVYGMRHGEKETGPNQDLVGLSKEGKRQVCASVINNLMGIEFDALYCSQKFRALQTVVEAVSVLPKRNNNMGVETRLGFDYTGAPDLDKFGKFTAEVKSRSEQEKRPITIGLWREVAPKTVDFLSNRVWQEIYQIAKTYHSTRKNEVNMFVGSHSPTIELASNDLNMPILKEADIVLYTVVVSEDITGMKIRQISTTYISRGDISVHPVG